MGHILLIYIWAIYRYKKMSKNRKDLKFLFLKSSIGHVLENDQKSPKKRNDLKFRNDLWVSTVATFLV